MTVKLHSYLGFDGNAKEAIEFYKSVFGGEVFTDTFENYADRMPAAEADKGKLLHGYLKGDNGIELMIADTPSNAEFTKGSQIALALNGDDEATLRGYWDKLSQGGTIAMPLEKAPWGDIFGMLTDKFGVTWMVDIGPAQSQEKRGE
jgi:PhnB protein